jgi:alpha-maltose-1-phosphate synthase
MRVVHLLRKYDPTEWGGTETVVQRLCDGLRRHNVTVMYGPRLDRTANTDHEGVRRFKACVPVWGISRQEKRQRIAVGGNLMSFDLLPALWREPDVSVIHTHALGRLGGIASVVARGRHLPFVVSIHGGLFDLPDALQQEFNGPSRAGFEWGKIFGLLLKARQLISHADAVLVCNPKEAELVRQNHPATRVELQRHGIHAATYQNDHRTAARDAFPQIRGRPLLLCVGRIDPVKNQEWLIAQAPEIFRNHPKALLVFAGACMDKAYQQSIEREIGALGLADHVFFTGGLPPGDPRLIGLLQEAQALLLPSISETFGLVLLEAWAAGTTVIASRTSGASALVKDGENGWLFDLHEPQAFHEALNWTLANPGVQVQLAAAGRKLVHAEYDLASVVSRVKQLYEELVEAKHALRNPA